MGPCGGRPRNGDRFIKHPTACTLVVTNQLNWIVWAQCFSGLWCNQAIYVPHQDKRTWYRMDTSERSQRQHRTFVLFVVESSSLLFSSRPVTDEPRCDTRKATPLNHHGPERHILPSLSSLPPRDHHHHHAPFLKEKMDSQGFRFPSTRLIDF